MVDMSLGRKREKCKKGKGRQEGFQTSMGLWLVGMECCDGVYMFRSSVEVCRRSRVGQRVVWGSGALCAAAAATTTIGRRERRTLRAVDGPVDTCLAHSVTKVAKDLRVRGGGRFNVYTVGK